ncbi:MAG: ribosome maturation factor RimM [Lachnospiraceae bacterium]|nr:ribosome maturation factor RimM [Lachnospiraceae bacterium]
MENYFRVGVIANTHGLKGQVKIYPTTDDTSRFDDLDQVYVDTGNDLKPLHIKNVSYFKNMVIASFKEYNDINDILPFKGKDLLIDRADAIPLEEDEFYIADMIGAPVFADNFINGKLLDETTDFNEIGKVKDIFDTGANFVIEVTLNKPYVKKTKSKTKVIKDILLPLIPECVIELNDNEKFVNVHIMNGLLD